MENKPPEESNETSPEVIAQDIQEQPQDEHPPAQPEETAADKAEQKAKEDPYWVNRIPAKIFHTICMVLGIIFTVVGAVFLAFLDTMVGLILLGCGGIMFFAGISGLRELRQDEGE